MYCTFILLYLQDDLAGIGKDCPHRNVGQTSCIRGGRIDASCCVDAYFHTACHQTSDITGVVCCKVKGQKPQILVRPREKLVESERNVFLLSCQSSGSPPPAIHWYRNGRQITATGKGRVSIISTGLAARILFVTIICCNFFATCYALQVYH